MDHAKDKILVVGGYGTVGSVVSRELAQQLSFRRSEAELPAQYRQNAEQITNTAVS